MIDRHTPTPTLDFSGMEVLTYEDCRALLSIAKVGRLGSWSPAVP